MDFCATLRSRLVHGGGAASGLLVIDGETGTPVCARAPGRPRPLASNMKLFTTSAALSRLGPQSRIATTLRTDGGIDRNGVLHGSLYLVGGGDPALGTPSFYRRFLGGLGTNLFLLKRQVREAGITSITGRLYADDSVFDRLRGVADSGYATSSYIGPLSGLALNSGYSTASAQASPPTQPQRRPRPSPSRCEGPASAFPPSRPRHGATLQQRARQGRIAAADRNRQHHRRLLRQLLRRDADQAAGRALRRRRARTAAGAKVVEQFARGHSSGVHAVDGSGLTRSNRASPTQVVGLLRSMHESPAGDDFIQDLALTGHEGTVADRMHGTAAYGRCRTKTGTLTGVSNLSGYCFNRDGKLMIFSILMAGVSNLSLAHLEQDLIAAEIASY